MAEDQGGLPLNKHAGSGTGRIMKTEQLKDGAVTYQQSERMVALAEKWLLEYFDDGVPRRPGELEDDFAGEPGIGEMLMKLQGRWRDTPFFPALSRLIDKGSIVYEQADDGDVWYALPGSLPSETIVMPNDQALRSVPGRSSLHEVLCHVRMFKPQFARLVESGAKCQTVRPTPKRMPKPGDRISLRMWTGKPYRSKQRVLRESVIAAVEPFDLDAMRLWRESDRDAFARADGFGDWPEMLQWFISTHGYPFKGVVIFWQ